MTATSGRAGTPTASSCPRRCGCCALPGHTIEDISTLVGTADGVLAFTHAWWRPDGPVDDPYAPDAAVLAASRRLLLAAADTIVPGHGSAFPAAEALT